jgi:hypothetical protein
MDLFGGKTLSRVSSNENYGKLIDLLDTYKLKGSTTSKTIMGGMNYDYSDLIVETRFVLMTPKLAKIILDDHNVDNRPVSKTNTQKLIKEMESGNWMFNGDTITFDYNGRQKNGQHRLIACLQSGFSFPVIVVSGVTPESFMSMDNGRKRNGGDILGIEGVKNSAMVASTIKTIFAFKNNRYGVNVSTQVGALSNTEVLERYYIYNNERVGTKTPLDDAIKYGMKMSKRDESLLSPTLVSTFHYLLTGVDYDKGLSFMEQLCLGYGIEKGSSVQSLRTKITKTKTDKNYKLTHSELIGNIVYAWQKFKNNEKCKNIRLPENFDMSI